MKIKNNLIFKNILKLLAVSTFSFILVFSHFYFSPQAHKESDFFIKTAFSAITDNVRGFAHSSDSNSWVSFNCANDPNVGGQNIFTFTFSTSTDTSGSNMHFSFPTCAENDFGVNIDDDTGEISGRALSDHYGFINFNHSSHSYEPKAYYNSSTKEITGTAYVENLGPTDGKVNFSDVYVTPSNGFWHGHMTNSEMGNIKLNCDDSTPSGHPSCMENFFKVKYIMPLKIEEVSAPNWSPEQACGSFANRSILRWQTIGDPQSAYQVIIDTDSVRDDDTPYFDSGKITSTASQYVCPNAEGCSLDYDTSYYFWVRLWDSLDDPTDWTQFDHNDILHTLTDNEDYNTNNSPDPNLTFTTYAQEFPDVFFDWNPEEIVIGEDVYFDGDGNYYTNSEPNFNPQPCTETTCDYEWDSTVATNISNATNSTTTVIFTQSTDGSVSLTVTNPFGYSCSTSSPISIDYETPIWKEVKPE